MVVTPSEDFSGADHLTYTIVAPSGEQRTATVELTVTAHAAR